MFQTVIINPIFVDVQPSTKGPASRWLRTTELDHNWTLSEWVVLKPQGWQFDSLFLLSAYRIVLERDAESPAASRA